MKILIALFIVFAVSGYVFSQEQITQNYAKIISDNLIERTNGYFVKRNYEDGWLKTTIGISSNYNFDMVRRDVRDMLNNMENVTVLIPWEKQDTGYATGVRLPDDKHLMMIYYVPNRNNILVNIYNKK